MNLQVAKNTLEYRPPKRFIELTAYEAIAMVVVASLLVMLV